MAAWPATGLRIELPAIPLTLKYLSITYSVCPGLMRSGHERQARPSRAAERGAQIRDAAPGGLRGRDGRRVAAQRRPGLYDPAAAGAGWPGRVGRRGRRAAKELSDHRPWPG